MYYIYGISGPSLLSLIESTDSMIISMPCIIYMYNYAAMHV